MNILVTGSAGFIGANLVLRLIGLANQFSLYIYAKGGLMNDSERAYDVRDLSPDI